MFWPQREIGSAALASVLQRVLQSAFPTLRCVGLGLCVACHRYAGGKGVIGQIGSLGRSDRNSHRQTTLSSRMPLCIVTYWALLPR